MKLYKISILFSIGVITYFWVYFNSSWNTSRAGVLLSSSVIVFMYSGSFKLSLISCINYNLFYILHWFCLSCTEQKRLPIFWNGIKYPVYVFFKSQVQTSICFIESYYLFWIVFLLINLINQNMVFDVYVVPIFLEYILIYSCCLFELFLPFLIILILHRSLFLLLLSLLKSCEIFQYSSILQRSKKILVKLPEVPILVLGRLPALLFNYNKRFT